MSAVAPDTLLPLNDPRIPPWVLGIAASFDAVSYVVRRAGPAPAEWWLLDADGDLIEAVWLKP